MKTLIDAVNGHILESIRPRMRASPTLKDVIIWAEAFQASSGTLSLGMALGQGAGCSPFCGCAAKQIAELVGDELRERFPEIKRAAGAAAFPAAAVLDAWGVKGRALPPASPAPQRVPEDSPETIGTRVFNIALSPRCYRLKPDAVGAHAPPRAGLYEFVVFDEKKNPEIIFVGLSWPRTIQDVLREHLDGRLEPSSTRLFEYRPDVYFDFVEETDARSAEDYQDLAAALVSRHGPRFNEAPAPLSGRFARVAVAEG